MRWFFYTALQSDAKDGITPNAEVLTLRCRCPGGGTGEENKHQLALCSLNLENLTGNILIQGENLTFNSEFLDFSCLGIGTQ